MPTKPLRAVVFQHLPFENLGSLQPELKRRGFSIQTVDVTITRIPLRKASGCDLLIVLGGPIGVYDSGDYPFLKSEIDCIGARLAARKPTLGICLGAQLMAGALGSRVYPGSRGAEIGWFPLLLSGGASVPAWFAPLLSNDLRLFHWHGDTFDLPTGAKLLASSQAYANQAFSIGNALALQFHPEVTELGLERWYVGHSCELRQKGISVNQLRADAQEFAPALLNAANLFWKLWLDYIL